MLFGTRAQNHHAVLHDFRIRNLSGPSQETGFVAIAVVAIYVDGLWAFAARNCLNPTLAAVARQFLRALFVRQDFCGTPLDKYHQAFGP